MNETRLATIEQIREFLQATAEVGFSTPLDATRLRAFIVGVLTRFRYDRQIGRAHV